MHQLTSSPDNMANADFNIASKQKRLLRERFYILLCAADILAIVVGFGVAQRFLWSGVSDQFWTLILAVSPLFISFNRGGYTPATLRNWRVGVSSALGALISAGALVFLVVVLIKAFALPSRLLLLYGTLIAAGVMVFARAMIGRWCRRAFGGEPMSLAIITDGMVVVCPPNAQRIAMDGMGGSSDLQHPLVLDRLSRQLDGIDTVYVACAPQFRNAWATALKGNDLRVELLMPELDTIGVLDAHHFAGVASMMVSTGQMAGRDRVAKRALDLAIAVPVLMFLAPLLVFVAIAVRFDTPGPILFKQRRVGQGNRIFMVNKFRSMRVESSDADGNRSADRDDERITRVGRFIRSTSIDELPQLFNILAGDMSFVGPRPHALGSLAGDKPFWEVDARYSHRHICKPGLTGLAQVRGFRGATHRSEDLINRLQSDLEYINGWSVWRDISILIATGRVVVHRNAY